MLILFLSLLPLILAHLLVMWFETEFIIEYVKLLKLDRIFKIFNIYIEQEKAGSPLGFKEFLISSYDSYWTRLLICPICLSTALSGIVTTTLAIFTKELILYWILWFPIAYSSLFFYSLIKKLK